MNTIFFGSPQIAADLLELLIKNEAVQIDLVITQPDKPAGKDLCMTPTPVKTCALKHDIPVLDTSLKEEKSLELLRNTIRKNRVVLGILFAYGALIKPEVITLFKYGIWNVHPSLLPRYRGSSPTAYPLILNDKTTGVTLMELVEKLDAGPILAQTAVSTEGITDRTELETVLTHKGEALIRSTLQKIATDGTISKTLQDDSKSTYTRLLKKEDGYISSQLLKHALENEEILDSELPEIMKEYKSKYQYQNITNAKDLVYNLYRGLSPWPGVWTTIETSEGKRRLKLCKMSRTQNKLILDIVQLEGKKPVEFKTFNKAYSLTDIIIKSC